MKPAPFDYHAPETVEDCLSVLAQHGDEAKILAGGQSLVPMLALRLARPEVLVDVNRVRELAAVRRENGSLVVGATTRHATLESDPEIAAGSPLLARVAPHIGHFQIRNRGTLGGSLAHADPAAELPAVVRVLDAEIEVAGPNGIRRIRGRGLLRDRLHHLPRARRADHGGPLPCVGRRIRLRRRGDGPPAR